jgi:small multidrug resistance family-3 protein
VTGKTLLIIVGFLIIATTLEVSGDALVRNGIAARTISARTLYFLVGAILVFGYALTLNLAPIEFHKVVGIYIATLFIVWQIVSFAFFRTRPDLPIMIGGSLIVAGGLVVAFWQRTPHV